MTDPIQNTSKRLTLHTLVPVTLMTIGAALMGYMVYAEGEPGGLPLLLIAVGAGWYLVVRARVRPQPQ